MVAAGLFLDEREVGLAGPGDLCLGLSEGRVAGVFFVGFADLGKSIDFDGLRDDSLLLQTTLSLRKRLGIQGSPAGLLQQHDGRRFVGTWGWNRNRRRNWDCAGGDDVLWDKLADDLLLDDWVHDDLLRRQ